MSLLVICLSGFETSTIRRVAIIHRRRRASISPTRVPLRPLHRVRVGVINELIRGRGVKLNCRRVHRDRPFRLASKGVFSLLTRIPSFWLEGSLFHLPFVVPYLFILRPYRRLFRSQVTFNFRTTFVFFSRFRHTISIVRANFRRNRIFKVV